jgi:hypothetical protein
MMAIFQGAMLLVFGVGLMLVAYRSLATGKLPCGPDIFLGLNGRFGFKRDGQPLIYWLMFALYGTTRLRLLVLGMRLLTGQAEPLPLN